MSSVLTLLTDFGLQDPYVGSMKGVIAGIAPQVQVIDLTHLIPPQDIAAARFCLMQACSDFPQGTIHVAVVDPGVGGCRRAVAIQTAEAYWVGPDNGLFSGILECSPPLAAVALTRSQWWRSPSPSATFHGRDLFAPVAAHLANGVSLDQLGDPISFSSLVTLDLLPCQSLPTGLRGSIQYQDHFGNLITTLPGCRVLAQGWQIRVGNQVIPMGLTFSSVSPGERVALIGSHGWVEIAVNQGHAGQSLGLSVGDPITLEFLPISPQGELSPS